MKKYILGLGITPILLGITMAGTISCEDGNCNPSQFNLNTEGKTCSQLINVTNIQGENGDMTIGCYIDGEYANLHINTFINGLNNEIDQDTQCEYDGVEANEYTEWECEIDNANGTFTFTYGNTNPEPDPEPDPGTGGGTTGGGNEGGIVSGGINAFNGIIERLSSIFGEFAPYILYIAIACLGISLLFKALKSLLGFTNNKAKNSIGGRTGMKKRRKRRRQQRRKKRTEQEARKYYTNDNYDRNEAGNGKLYRRSRKNSNYLKQYRYKR